jgi:hypothetical protein
MLTEAQKTKFHESQQILLKITATIKLYRHNRPKFKVRTNISTS